MQNVHQNSGVEAICPPSKIWGKMSWGILSFGAKCLGAKCLLAVNFIWCGSRNLRRGKSIRKLKWRETSVEVKNLSQQIYEKHLQGRDASFACSVRNLGGYRVKIEKHFMNQVWIRQGPRLTWKKSISKWVGNSSGLPTWQTWTSLSVHNHSYYIGLYFIMLSFISFLCPLPVRVCRTLKF